MKKAITIYALGVIFIMASFLAQAMETELHNAASNGFVDRVRALLGQGIQVNANDRKCRTPLHYAAGKGHEAVVELLLENKAEINPQDVDLMTPLHWAAVCGHGAAVHILLERGVDLAIRDNKGKAPIDIACRKVRAIIERFIRWLHARCEILAFLGSHHPIHGANSPARFVPLEVIRNVYEYLKPS